MKIETIDKNFQEKSINDRKFLFRSVLEEPFVLDGFAWRSEIPDTPFFRAPIERLKGKVNDGAISLCRQTAGGSVRFCTDSDAVAIQTTLKYSSDMNHMPRAGSSGFDLYLITPTGPMQIGGIRPTAGAEDLEGLLCSGMPAGEKREFILNFPLYGGTTRVEIGISEGANLYAPAPYTIDKPIVFYGSSITQGGCASRPGNCYTSMLARALNARQVNLGFSGSGRGEPAMAELIAELDMSLFVMDYDHNAPNPEHLQATHEPFFNIIREKHPDLPVIMASRCDIWPEIFPDPANEQRREIVRATWKKAVDAGDKNVYFIDGGTLFGTEDREACTVDRCHPNDLGFYRMYKAFLPVARLALANAGWKL